jgi:hypothetical protein
MGFKFDEDDNELSLDIGGDIAKTPTPTPLPPKQKSEEAEAPPQVFTKPSIPTQPKPVEATSDVLKGLPRPGQTVSKPAGKPKEDDLNALLKEPSTPTPQPTVKEVETSYEAKPQSTLMATPLEKKEPVKTVPIEEPFKVDSDVILTREEFNGTFVKSKGNPFSGARKKVMQVRIAAGLVATLLMVAGIFSFLPKGGFTSDVAAQVLALNNGNQYESIRQASESLALKTMTDLINVPDYSTLRSQKDRMSSYLDSDTVISLTNNFKLNTYPIKPSAIRDTGYFYQKVLNGPYVDNQEVIDIGSLQRLDLNNDGYKESFIYPIRIAAYVQYVTDDANEKRFATATVPALSAKWVYYVVPVLHNYKTKATFIYGLPSVAAALPTDDASAVNASFKSPWDASDPNLTTLNIPFKTTFAQFFTAWAKQDSVSSLSNIAHNNPDLQNLLSTTDTTSPLYPTYRIAQGLQDRYVLSDIKEIDVQALPDKTTATDSTIRNALVTVTWKDNTIQGISNPNSKLVPSTITQQYLVEFIGVAKWYFIDVKPRFAE